MPAVPIGALIASSAIGAGGAVAASALGARASGKATQAAQQSNDAALAFEREQELQRQKEWQQTQDWNKESWARMVDLDNSRYASEDALTRYKLGQDVSQFNQDQVRKAPYRDASLAALNRLVGNLGLTVVPSAANRPHLEGPPAAPAQPMSELARILAARST